MRRVLFVVLAILSVAASAEGGITPEHVLDLLAKEKASVQKQDYAALEALMRAIVVLEDGIAKYRYSEYVSGEPVP